MNSSLRKIFCCLLFLFLDKKLVAGISMGQYFQTVYDSYSRLSIENLERWNGLVLCFMEIRPSAKNGTRYGDALIDEKTGRLLPYQGSGKICDGTWKLIANLSSVAVKDSGNYNWDIPDNRGFSGPGNSRLYSPYSENGGFVICSYDEKKTGRNQFGNTIMLPPGWEKQVEPAWKYFRENPVLFRIRESKAPPDVKKLLELQGGENPVLAIEACRTLESYGLQDRPALMSVIKKSRDTLQAVLILLHWGSLEEKKDKIAFIDELINMIDAASYLEEIKGVVAVSYFLSDRIVPPMKENREIADMQEIKMLNAWEKKAATLKLDTDEQRDFVKFFQDQKKLLLRDANPGKK